MNDPDVWPRNRWASLISEPAQWAFCSSARSDDMARAV
jgi:hypothetical protein